LLILILLIYFFVDVANVGLANYIATHGCQHRPVGFHDLLGGLFQELGAHLPDFQYWVQVVLHEHRVVDLLAFDEGVQFVDLLLQQLDVLLARGSLDVLGLRQLLLHYLHALALLGQLRLAYKLIELQLEVLVQLLVLAVEARLDFPFVFGSDRAVLQLPHLSLELADSLVGLFHF